MEFIKKENYIDASFLSKSICKLQILEQTNWSLVDFSLHLSSLFHICAKIFDEDLINLILNTFSNNFDWNSYLTFILDPGLFISSFYNLIISSLFTYYAQYPLVDIDIINTIYSFLISILNLLIGEKYEIDSLIGFLFRLRPSSNVFISSLTTFQLFNENLLSSRFQYFYPLIIDNFFIDYILEIPNLWEFSFILKILPIENSINILFKNTIKNFIKIKI